MKIEVIYETTSFEINEITVDINNIDELEDKIDTFCDFQELISYKIC